MSALKKLTSTTAQLASANNVKSVTNISVHARVDYTLKFSTPAVFVLDDKDQGYGHVTSHYLEAVAGTRNSAYVACSSHLNNIQIRCRIVEQLFGEQLFDPEEPLAVSIINLMKKGPQPTSIVLEHSQFLSLQIVHEVCQLGQIAKKSGLDIQVLLVGAGETAHLISENTLLFKGKVAVVAADDAQLISLQADRLKRPKLLFKLPNSVKFIALFTTFALLLISGVYALFKLDVVNFSSLPDLTAASVIEEPVMVLESAPMESDNPTSGNSVQKLASSEEVLSAIMASETVTPLPAEPATSKDIFQALTGPNQTENTKPELQINGSAKPSADESIAEEPVLPKWPAHAPYKLVESGFVIQYGGFTSESVKDGFIRQYPNLEYLSYNRILNGREMTVLTSDIFASRDLVQQALLQLSPELIARGVWIKGVFSIKDEISAFEASQLN